MLTYSRAFCTAKPHRCYYSAKQGCLFACLTGKDKCSEPALGSEHWCCASMLTYSRAVCTAKPHKCYYSAKQGCLFACLT